MKKITEYFDKLAATPNRNVISRMAPGLIVCFIVMFVGIYAADFIGLLIVKLNLLPEGSSSPVSGIFVAILIGILIRNFIGLHKVFIGGVMLSVKYALRAGIILLGLRLSLIEAVKLGAWGVPLIIACISCGLLVTLYFTKKMQQSERLGTLIACGTGICGVTAIMATSPIIKAKEDEISYAVANITIFGLTGMVLYPLLANFLFTHDPIKAGLFLGTAIHDTAQVTGAALIYNQMFNTAKIIDVATVTKLTRNLFIIIIIPFVSYLFFKNNTTKRESESENEKLPKWYSFIPLFVIGFLVFSLIRTVGDITLTNKGSAFGLFELDIWKSIYNFSGSFGTTYLLGMAMAGVGLSTNFKIFKGIGIKPFFIGFTSAISVGIVSLVLISIFGHLVVI